MEAIKNYTMALVSFVATLVLTLVAEFVLKLSPEGTYLTFVVGTSITLAITLLEKNLETQFEDSVGKTLELYQLVASVDDSELQYEVFKLAKSLSSGEIPPHITATRSVKLFEQVEHSIHASDYSEDLQLTDRWKGSRLKGWYKLNHETIKRGVTTERIFILKKSDVIKDNVWDKATLDILQKQSEDGVLVKVLWVEDVVSGDLRPQRDVLRNLVIFDRKEVLETTRIERRLYRSPSDKVKGALATFEEQRKFSQNFEDVLAEGQGDIPLPTNSR